MKSRSRHFPLGNFIEELSEWDHSQGHRTIANTELLVHKDGLGELQERLQLKAGEVWREHSTAKGAGLPDVLGPHPLSGARM